jgi:hypothetical protein
MPDALCAAAVAGSSSDIPACAVDQCDCVDLGWADLLSKLTTLRPMWLCLESCILVLVIDANARILELAAAWMLSPAIAAAASTSGRLLACPLMSARTHHSVTGWLLPTLGAINSMLLRHRFSSCYALPLAEPCFLLHIMPQRQ